MMELWYKMLRGAAKEKGKLCRGDFEASANIPNLAAPSIWDVGKLTVTV
jgi:hypothetical protein